VLCSTTYFDKRVVVLQICITKCESVVGCGSEKHLGNIQTWKSDSAAAAAAAAADSAAAGDIIAEKTAAAAAAGTLGAESGAARDRVQTETVRD